MEVPGPLERVDPRRPGVGEVGPANRSADSRPTSAHGRTETQEEPAGCRTIGAARGPQMPFFAKPRISARPFRRRMSIPNGVPSSAGWRRRGIPSSNFPARNRTSMKAWSFPRTSCGTRCGRIGSGRGRPPSSITSPSLPGVLSPAARTQISMPSFHPNQYPPEVWRALARRGGLESTGQGFYKIPLQRRDF
jgi:hypothetical protein